MYYRFIRTCPFTLVTLVFTLCFCLFGYAVFHHGIPSFDDPLVGFEVRKVDLSNRINTWRLLIESTSWNGMLSLNPKIEQNISVVTPSKSQSSFEKDSEHIDAEFTTLETNENSKEEPSQNNPFGSKNHQVKSHFCGSIYDEYIQFVVETKDGSNLLNVESMRDLCYLDQYVFRMEDVVFTENNLNQTIQFHFRNYCEVKNLNDCCPSWSLVNYVMLFANRNHCDDLSQHDIDMFVEHLESCSDYFADHSLNEDCLDNADSCSKVPLYCMDYENLAFNVFNYLADYHFLDIDQQILSIKNDTIMLANETEQDLPLITSTSIFLPVAKSSNLMPYYNAISGSIRIKHYNMTTQSKPLSYGNVHVVATDLGLKNTLFSQALVSDLTLAVIAGLIILLSLFIFTRSLILTIVTLLTNVASLATAYFIYMCLLDIKFFPFLNLLSFIILIGIGSDNALIYCKAWNCVTSTVSSPSKLTCVNRRNDYENQLQETLHHVLMSSFCASLTTCGAFFTGYFSNITSLKCFSIFAGTSIITNFFITVLVFPSAILISENINFEWNLPFKFIKSYNSALQNMFYFIFGKMMLKIIFNYRYVAVISLSTVAVVSSVAVLYKPGLQLPQCQDFQIFSSTHLFEQYDLKYKNEFWFSRNVGLVLPDTPDNSDGELAAQVMQSSYVLPIRVVFGVLPADTGDPVNPFDRGHLVFDPQFSIATPHSQMWLLDFCREIRTQPFYKPIMGPVLTNCFIETFKSWMESRRCSEQLGTEFVERYPCCEQSRFPYDQSTFDQCLVEMVERLQRTPNYMYHANRAGPRFNVSSGKATVRAVVIEYDSLYDAFATSYLDMQQHYQEIDNWVKSRIETAPKGLRNGFFITSNLEFYTLQNSLSTGVLNSVLISVFFAFITLVITTWNFRLSLISTVTISFIIFTTVATLILLGWRLNIIESITISLTIGLAIDATLHYTIAFKLLTKGNRLLGIQKTVARIASPVAMGAITTFVAGAIMLFSSILAYIQIGTFLMVLSATSWLFSTILHLSLLSIFGSHHEDSFFLLSYLGNCIKLSKPKSPEVVETVTTFPTLCSTTYPMSDTNTATTEPNPTSEKNQQELCLRVTSI